MRMFRTIVASIACAAVLAGASAQAQTANPYAPYEFLIGDWDTGDGIRQSFSWGPEQAYIRYSTTTRGRDGADHLHFEGIMVYNAANRNLDFLVALEPGSLAQEQGTLHVEADGSVVRDVTLTGANGARSHFRQTFRSTGPASAVTSLMRQNASGAWGPNFPGSDNLAMTRRAG
ncbi:hypothetical protein U91I_00320 [alpha proteobacterium U9-1i]|nr:hypothetical protein U91I_00320 [alpha proteobacterium U9-1i]